jgi:hypothetical protein
MAQSDSFHEFRNGVTRSYGSLHIYPSGISSYGLPIIIRAIENPRSGFWVLDDGKGHSVTTSKHFNYVMKGLNASRFKPTRETMTHDGESYTLWDIY